MSVLRSVLGSIIIRFGSMVSVSFLKMEKVCYKLILCIYPNFTRFYKCNKYTLIRANKLNG